MFKKLLFPIAFIGISGAIIYSLKPNKARKAAIYSMFKNNLIAHRGLFNNKDIPENSMKAFREAIKNGYCIELDVQLTKDNKAVIFHDETLKRICGDERLLRNLKSDELKKLKLCSTCEHIPLFVNVLNTVSGKVPLLVEIKPEGRYIEAAKQAAKLLKNYKGDYCIESFNPLVLFWFRLHCPDVLRGQLSTDFKKDGDTHSAPIQFVLTNMLTNFLSKPDFISYNHKYCHKKAFSFFTKKLHIPAFAWTIKNASELKKAKKDFDFFIFDSFKP